MVAAAGVKATVMVEALSTTVMALARMVTVDRDDDNDDGNDKDDDGSDGGKSDNVTAVAATQR